MATAAACGSSPSGSTSRSARDTASCRSTSSVVRTRRPPRNSTSSSFSNRSRSCALTRSAYSGALVGGSGGVSRTGLTPRSSARLASALVMKPFTTMRLSVYFWRSLAVAMSRTGFHALGAGAMPASRLARASSRFGSGCPVCGFFARSFTSTPK